MKSLSCGVCPLIVNEYAQLAALRMLSLDVLRGEIIPSISRLVVDVADHYNPQARVIT